MSEQISPRAQFAQPVRDVRVRFCPSPTGSPHVGLIRTALFNWAYARHTGGKFVFRIEDTDAARDTAESAEHIIEAMRWLGLDWDEGVEVGGPHGPYRQSERTDIYRDVLAKLVESGHVYESFSTAEEIAARNDAASRPQQLGYDNFDRELTEQQRSVFRSEGRMPALRLRVPNIDFSFTDLVRGPITFPAGSFPDFVVVRPDGSPLYTFVNPVDDVLMGITHVLRGEDLLSSTPRQMALYHALIDVGIASHMPEFGHLPYVMGEGNKKLSKRDPQSHLFHYRDRGFVPEGLLNYLALLGWSLTHDRDIFSIDEMIAAFEIGDVNPNPARFDIKKAESINGDHIRLLSVDDFARRLFPYLAAEGIVSEPISDTDRVLIQKIAPHVQERVAVLADVPAMIAFLFTPTAQLTYEEGVVEGLPAEAGDILARAENVVSSVSESEWNHEVLENRFRAALVDEGGWKPRIAFGPLRVALCGRRVSPPLFESMELVGPRATVDRLEKLRSVVSSS